MGNLAFSESGWDDYLNQKETEPIEQNTVKFEELQKDERISDSNAVESGPVS